ncbi:282fc8d4-ef07-4b79-8b3b-8d689f3e4931 [Thermothielavioides terrestris]|uniref:TeaA receptor TeaR n=2 Tax=Thermothielavioides terrestris TaxID=2587410 RepID=G2QXT4_THETT|nr:uncharacterized protein THITE_2108117 [Thermothielavioides terrestris NRRL 8126]AEO63202.1 hypothetical protein THITE_2108117 [Thermothielavioides terrestris NRRL 8126]SPQ21308.1 282fc8d4-ef07-4b79-8b3b-8d689f3e4931 [Thermothielavioides terrestris]
MATVSQTATALTSPAHVWEDALPTEPEAHYEDDLQAVDEDPSISGRRPLASQNGNSTVRGATGLEPLSPGDSNEESGPDSKAKGLEPGHLLQHDHRDPKPRSVKERRVAESSPGLHGAINGERPEDGHANRKGQGSLYPDSDSDENSKWIHRDKLARIESEELQAAGIFLPRQRDRARSKSQNRPRRDQSQDKVNGSGRSIGSSEYTVSRSRKNSTATTSETRTVDSAAIPSWDLRRPEEILEEADGHWVPNGSGKGSSRIPLAKDSPVPIPSEHLARDTRLVRKRDSSPTAEDGITNPRQRARSGSTGNSLTKISSAGPAPHPNKRSDSSPKKPAAAATARKPKPANGAAGRPKTRGGPSKDSTSSGTGTGTRPSTRSGEREFSSSNSKPMEGEPPWMVSAYRPDPRLPPDQQLLPTVAKRLQQEKWEREGKFGSVYDKEFRPLTDDGFLKPPEPAAAPDKESAKEGKDDQKEEQGDWPLKPEAKSPTLPARANSYSTMPKITDAPAANPLPSPRAPSRQAQQTQPIRLPEPPDEPAQKKGGCGCCIVM